VGGAPGDYPGGKKGDVLTVEFTVLGIPCLGLNGGPAFRHTEAFSFQIATENQEETDRSESLSHIDASGVTRPETKAGFR
jgi:predicted 3-demethylubiquinone-9 3-methyltransferase (glyoxalase superfamily)